MTEDIQDKVESLFETDMKTQETMKNILDEEDPDDVKEAAIGVSESIVSNIENPDLERYAWTTLTNLGSAIGSDELMVHAASNLERWAVENGKMDPDDIQ